MAIKSAASAFLRVHVKTRGFSVGRKKDKDVSAWLNQSRGTGELYVSFAQWLPESVRSDVCKSLNKAQAAYRRPGLTQEWGTEGRVVPVKKFKTLSEEVGAAKDELERKLVYYFEGAGYERTRDAAKLLAGPDWDPGKFPTSDQFRDSFSIDFSFGALSTPDKFALEGLESHVVESLRKEVEREHEAAFESYIAHEVEDTLEVLHHARESIANGDDKTRYGHLLSKAKRQAERVRDMNPTGDARLDRLANKLDELVEGVDADALRDSKAARGKLKKNIEDALGLDWFAAGEPEEEEPGRKEAGEPPAEPIPAVDGELITEAELLGDTPDIFSAL